MILKPIRNSSSLQVVFTAETYHLRCRTSLLLWSRSPNYRPSWSQSWTSRSGGGPYVCLNFGNPSSYRRC